MFKGGSCGVSADVRGLASRRASAGPARRPEFTRPCAIPEISPVAPRRGSRARNFDARKPVDEEPCVTPVRDEGLELACVLTSVHRSGGGRRFARSTR
jgi:hypothetical protein